MENDTLSFGLKQTIEGLVLIYLMFAQEEIRLNNSINGSSYETRFTSFHWEIAIVYFLPFYSELSHDTEELCWRLDFSFALFELTKISHTEEIGSIFCYHILRKKLKVVWSVRLLRTNQKARVCVCVCVLQKPIVLHHLIFLWCGSTDGV